MSIGCRILHLTDLHWHQETMQDQKLILRKLRDDIARVVKDRGIDIFVFSGDLVNKGGIAADFVAAKAELFDAVRDQFGLADNQILVCPGNHDVDRKLAVDQTYLESGLEATLKDVDALNAHADRFLEVPLDQDAACSRLTNYFDFVRKDYNKAASLQTAYVDCVLRTTPFGHIGFAMFNSAWRSTGAGPQEQHKLLVPERSIDKAAEQLKACDFRIAVVHHPLDWLAPWNERSIQTPLFLHFDLVLFGHVHEPMPTLQQNAIGECLFAQGGALYLHRTYYNGYQIIDLSRNDGVDVIFHLRTWFDTPRRDFGAAENICSGGIRQFHLRTKEAAKRLNIRQLLDFQEATDALANSHLQTLQLSGGLSFDNSFTYPPLAHKSYAELVHLSPGAYQAELLELSAAISAGSVLVFCGARESGKTTIAWKIAKEALSAPGATLKIPIIVDFSLLKKYDRIDRLVRRYITTLNLDIPASLVLASHRCFFVVDNVSMADPDKLNRLRRLICETKDKHDWCIFLDEVDLLTAKDVMAEFETPTPPIYIQPFGRPEIRDLVIKISSSTTRQEALDFSNIIIKLIDDNQLPRNPYIVTLISSVLSNASTEVIINEASLLDKMIDLLLNKQDPENLVRKSTDFAGRNIILKQIAFWLKDHDSYIGENDLIGKLAEFLKERGILESARDLLNQFIAAGILEKRADDLLCFRYRSFESYFLARYYARNKNDVPDLLEDLGIIKYAKEFSLLCDLFRNDADLLNYLEVIILELEPKIFSKIDKSAFMHVDVKVSAEVVVDKVLEHIFRGPQTLRMIDERYDLVDRARIALDAKMKDAPLSLLL